MIALGLLRALGLRGSLVLVCLLVLAVTAYGVADDLGLLNPPAQAAFQPECTPGRRLRAWSDSTLPTAASTAQDRLGQRRAACR